MLGACAPTPDAIGQREEAVLNGVASADRAVVGFSFSNTNGDQGDCSGTFVGSHLILTAYHCAFENDSTPLTLGDGTDGELGMRHPAAQRHGLTFKLAPAAYMANYGSGTSWSHRLDYAIIGTTAGSAPARATIALAADADRPTPDESKMASLAGREVHIVGFSPNNSWPSVYRRRVGTMRITGNFGSYTATDGHGGNHVFLGFTLEPTSAGQISCAGDSGGAVLLDGKLIGIISSGTNHDGSGACIAEGYAHASFIDTSLIPVADTDGDGVINEADNCPNLANADQADSDELDPSDQPQGDACDPDVTVAPVAFFDPNDDLGYGVVTHADVGWNRPTSWPALGLVSLGETTGQVLPGDGFLGERTTTAHKKLYFRLTGYAGNASGTTHDVRPEYCGCHDADLSSAGHPVRLSEIDCDGTCLRHGYLGQSNPRRGTGWRRLTWQLRHADGTRQTCVQTRVGGPNGTFECTQPLGAAPQPFVRLYGTPAPSCQAGPALGCATGDYDHFWTSADRTRVLYWDYHDEEYPHPIAVPFNRNLTTMAWVRARVFPEDVFSDSSHMRRANGFDLPTQELRHGQTALVMLRPLYDLRPFFWRVPTVINPWRFHSPADHPGLGLVAPIHPETEMNERFFWSQEEGPSRGQVVSVIDATTLRLGPAAAAQREGVAALPAVGGALAQDGPWIVAYGGIDADGQASTTLSLARVDGDLLWQRADAAQGALAEWRASQGLSDTLEAWNLLAEDLVDEGFASFQDAPPIAHGTLVADLETNRVLMIFGEDAQGSLQPLAWRHTASAWLTFETPDHLARRQVAAAPSADGKTLYFYGGRAFGESLDGLYAVPLDPKALVTTSAATARLDGGAEVGPGHRYDARLALGRHGHHVYLFGGIKDGQRQRDLWRFDLLWGTWTLLSEGGGDEAPPAAPASALLVSKVDGSLLVVSGGASVDPDAQDAAYRFRLGRWWIAR